MAALLFGDYCMIFIINDIDFTDRIVDGGIVRTRNDLDDDSAGRDLTGTMQRSRVTTKIQLQVTCRPMTTEEISPLLTVLENNQVVSVTYIDPKEGQTTKSMYCNQNPATCMRMYGDQELWDSISFPLVEM